MGMSVGGDSSGLSSEPNVIPMIDILLVLLIIFMITQPLSRMAIDVQVPPMETAPGRAERGIAVDEGAQPCGRAGPVLTIERHSRQAEPGIGAERHGLPRGHAGRCEG